MKKERIDATKAPSRASLRAMPEVDFSRYRVGRNRFARRIAAEGLEIVHHDPGAAALREMPEPDLELARVRPNPYARRIRAGGISLQIGRGRPPREHEVGPTVTRSVRLPTSVWARIDKRARAEGIAGHALLRRAIGKLVG